MKLTNKNIKRIDFWFPILFSITLSLFINIAFDIHWYNLSYWVITIPLQILYIKVNNKIVDILYKVKENRRLRFKEFVKEDKY